MKTIIIFRIEIIFSNQTYQTENKNVCEKNTNEKQSKRNQKNKLFITEFFGFVIFL